jgi:uncharacterized membrane protein
MDVLGDAIAIGFLIVLILIAAIPLKPQRILYGIMILLFGIIPLLKLFGIIDLGIYTHSLFKFATIFVVMIVGQVLFTEGIKEQNMVLKVISVIFGLVIILVTMIPWMGEYKAISFEMPTYTPIIDFAIYLVSGILITIGAFKANY